MRTSISYACFICVLGLVEASLSWAQTATLAERFDRIDRDGDGKITAQELPRSPIFRRLDRNGDGVIEKAELSGGIGSPRGEGEQRGFNEHLDLAYGDHGQHKLDLYQPADAKDAPIMVYIHGGGWRRGDKRGVGEKVGLFVGRGWVFVSVNYRLLPEGRHPANVDDVARALAWMHDHAADYGGDREKLFVMGHSAGAHLAALVATSDAPLRKAGKRRAILKGAIPLDTNAYDIAKLMDSGAGFYGEVFGDDPDLWKDASPITHIARDAGIPPFLICYSRGMRPLMNPQRPVRANTFAEALRAAGIAAEVVDASDRNHGEINQWFGRASDEKVTGAAVKFLDAILTGKPAVGAKAGGPLPRDIDKIFVFKKDYFPGTVDARGQSLAGTETMNFAVHGGRLYAGLGNRNLPDDASVRVGAQVIVKDSANAAWRVEHQFARTAPRVNALISAAFTTDAQGNPLQETRTMLVAAPSDASGDQDGEDLRWATAWTRDDQSGDWTETRVYSAEERIPACRSFGVYHDPVTRVCHLFAGTSHGSIHRAVYDPTAPGRLVWNESAELDNVGRVVAFAECNGILYAACGLRRTREGITGGLYRRRNGPRADWECVYRWPWPARRGGADEAFLMRGLTAVPAPDGDGEVLLGSRAQPGIIERIDPSADYTVTTELDLREHFAKAWNLPNYSRAALSAYNTITRWTDPESGGQVHLIGVAVLHPTLADTPPHNGAWYLVRHSDGHYSTGYIYDSEHSIPAGMNLRGTRAMVVSPFDNTTVYAGGGDIGKQISFNTAWIYRATIPAVASQKART